MAQDTTNAQNPQVEVVPALKYQAKDLVLNMYGELDTPDHAGELKKQAELSTQK